MRWEAGDNSSQGFDIAAANASTRDEAVRNQATDWPMISSMTCSIPTPLQSSKKTVSHNVQDRKGSQTLAMAEPYPS